MNVQTTPKYRRGDWMQTYTGRQFWPLDPHPEDVDIRDIAHGLSHICRFGGHLDVFYPVAAHSVFVSKRCPGEEMEGLLHDATEAYMGDMVRPLKNYMPQFREVERRLYNVIAIAFDLRPLSAAVKAADNLALVTERRDLMLKPKPEPWAFELEEITPAATTLVSVPPIVAKVAFLQRFVELQEPALNEQAKLAYVESLLGND